MFGHFCASWPQGCGPPRRPCDNEHRPQILDQPKLSEYLGQRATDHRRTALAPSAWGESRPLTITTIGGSAEQSWATSPPIAGSYQASGDDKTCCAST